MEHYEARAMLAVIEEVNTTVNALVWGPPLMILLIGTGLYLSVRLGFIQFTHVVFMWRTTFGRLFARGTGQTRRWAAGHRPAFLPPEHGRGAARGPVSTDE